MAKYSKKRAKALKKDSFRDKTLGFFGWLGDRLEGKGWTILYGIIAVIALAALISLWSWWSARRTDEARLALGRAIEIAEAPVTPSPTPGTTGPTFPTEQARAERAVAEFEAVANRYGDPYRERARYFAAVNRLVVNREQGINELQQLSQSGDREVAAWAKFALAQAREADAQWDAAATLYSELAAQGEPAVVPVDTANLRLANVYERQGRRQEAVELLFNIAKSAREARNQAGNPATISAAAREATDKLQTLDPARYAQLPPEPPAGGNAPF